jgi:hypothetical protein
LACRGATCPSRPEQRSAEPYGAAAESGQQRNRDIEVSGNGLSADERLVVINLNPEQLAQINSSGRIATEPGSGRLGYLRAVPSSGDGAWTLIDVEDRW